MNEQSASLRHSRLGIASTVIVVGLPVLIVLLFALFLVAGFIFGGVEQQTGTSIGDKIKGGFLSVFYVVIIATPLLHLTGLLLGVIGAFSKQRKKFYAVLGTLLNLIFILLELGLFIYLLSKIPFEAFH